MHCYVAKWVRVIKSINSVLPINISQFFQNAFTFYLHTFNQLNVRGPEIHNIIKSSSRYSR